MTGRILIIDDDEDLNFLLPQILYSHQVLAVNPLKNEDIISLIASFLPSIILLDYHGVNGGTLCEVIKSKYPTLPVILFSAFGNLQRIVETFPFDAIIEKPFDADDLERRINEIESCSYS